MNVTAEQELWQAVLYNAVIEALYPGTGRELLRAKGRAITWLDGGGRDFRQVCEMGGLDPDFIQKAWKDHRFDLRALKNFQHAGPSKDRRGASLVPQL